MKINFFKKKHGSILMARIWINSEPIDKSTKISVDDFDFENKRFVNNPTKTKQLEFIKDKIRQAILENQDFKKLDFQEITNSVELKSINNNMTKYTFLEKSIRKNMPIDHRKCKSINERLEWIRCALGYPVNKFANIIGSSKKAVLNILGDRNDHLSTKMVENICKVLSVVDENWIYVGIREPFTKDHTDFICGSNHKIPKIDEGVNGRVLEVRLDNGLTQALFASEIGTSRDSLAFIEINKSSASIPLVKRIIAKYNVNRDWMFYGDGIKYLRV